MLLLEDLACDFRSTDDVTINPLLVGDIKYGCCYRPSELPFRAEMYPMILGCH